jgi:hypothetical protein
MHGSGNKAARGASERRQTEAKALAAISSLLYNADAAPIEDPLEELARLTGVLRDAARVAGEQTNALAALTSRTGHGEQLRANVVLWTQLLQLFRGALVDMSKLNLEERQHNLAKRQGDAIVHGLRWLLEQLGLTDNARATTLVVEMLTALSEGREPAVPQLEAARARPRIKVVRE